MDGCGGGYYIVLFPNPLHRSFNVYKLILCLYVKPSQANHPSILWVDLKFLLNTREID